MMFREREEGKMQNREEQPGKDLGNDLAFSPSLGKELGLQYRET